MKINNIRSYIVNNGTKKHWIFVRIETDAGIVGWGEAYSQSDRENAIVSHLAQFGRYLVGRDPFQIKYAVTMLRDDYVHRRGSMEFYSALSGLEIALWDIVGQACNQPVHNLLGGRYRDRIRVYANGWAYEAKTPSAIAKAAEAVVSRGFTALKFDPFPLPVRTYVDRDVERHAVSMVSAVRDAVGDDVEMLIECSRRFSPNIASRFAKAIAELRPYWIEEPVPAFDLEGLHEVRQVSDAPIVAGETLYTKDDFRSLFAARAVDIINPDISACGGLLELKEIAANAEAHHIGVSPHNYNSTTVSLAATMQASAGMPNFLLTEYFLSFDEVGSEICDVPLVPVRGFIDLPERPGIGIALKEDELLKRAASETPVRTLRTVSAEA
ncbi:mandelate racemase/muconate lactonizing enzyme family protein [Mesorhizobium sp. M2D.F.Ca.ET.185.01.1.1]|uniref:mandelate racemase/muconate lactonizing enzyme family protein n=3 Tax=Mesorhizobium TaxID=68287 RepID=UPI000FCA9984|nr:MULTISPECIES: mandelate racemase/muconate lactonizing enzyme family protein [unclassified Mesorhizobium]TGP77338.1 mandelate racemase/muconate lactonizing enzyme family protein [bacterium M00.F.Ca.ET.227.01.1.1]TGP93132.1 mandelate racemase/muconate lactonizing enzyme family protein [bacterium M00.F.Ca.ET.222.01.1.1]TGP96678.1 mandelate racemase/muconate lactonizing enzyme family protein [bacterium M00.F.Ca.ET.221.01.1.1]TGT96615.1 mandelate racemase/muconate lactonizing enzyme family protei